jgi:hypothetical protein
MKATKLLVVPKSIPTIRSSFCKEPVAKLMDTFAMGVNLLEYKGSYLD